MAISYKLDLLKLSIINDTAVVWRLAASFFLPPELHLFAHIRISRSVSLEMIHPKLLHSTNNRREQRQLLSESTNTN